MKFSIQVILLILFNSIIFLANSQEVIHYSYLKNHEPDCDRPVTKSDSAYCMFIQAEEELNELKRVYDYCPDSLKYFPHKNCGEYYFDSLVVCIQKEVKVLINDRLESQKTSDDKAIIYNEYLSIYYFAHRKELDEFLYSHNVYGNKK